MLAVAPAAAYADLVAGTFVHNTRPSRTALGLTGREAAPLLIGAPLPVIVLVLSALGLLEIRRAVDLAQIVSYATHLIYGWLAVRRLEASLPTRIVVGLTFAAIGFVLVALKAAFH